MKKGLKITLIVVLSLIVVAGATLGIAYATNGDYVKNTFALMTKDDNEYFRWVTQNNVDKSVEESKTMLLSALNSEKRATGMTSDADFTVEISDEFLKTVAQMSGVDNMPKSIKPFGFNMVSAIKDGEFGSSDAVKYNGVELLKFATLIRTDAKEAYVSIPSYKSDAIDLTALARTDISQYFDVAEINKGFAELGIDFKVSESDVKDVFTLYSMFAKLAEQSTEGLNDQKSIDESIKDFNESLGKLLDEIDNAVLEKDVEVAINGVETKCNSLTVKITKNDILRLITKALNEHESDLKSMLKEQAKLPDEEINKFIEEMKTGIDKVKEDKQTNFSIDLVMYVNNKGEYIGATVKIGVAASKITLKFITVEEDKNNSQTGVELNVAGLRVVAGVINKEINGTEEKYTIDFKLGDIIKSVAPQLQNYALQIETVQDDGNAKAVKNSLELRLVDGKNKLASMKWDITINTEEAIMPIQIDNVNKIPYDKIADSDYISMKDFMNFVIEKIEAVNDEYINNAFLEGLRKSAGANATIEDLKKQVKDADFTPLDEEIKKSLKQLLSGGGLGTAIPGGIPDFIDAVPGNQPEPEPALNNSLDDLLDEVHTYSKSEYAAYITGFEYSDLDLSEELSVVDPVELERCKEEFLSSLEPAKVLSKKSDRTVQMSDEILFDAVPVMGGFTIKMYEYKGVPATVGEYEYGAGIDDMLVGMKVGESKVINLTLPDNFGDFAGYNSDFQITIAGIYDYIYPAWTEEYLFDVVGYSSFEECEQKIIIDNGLQDVTLDESAIMDAAIEKIFTDYIDADALDKLYSEKYDDYLEMMDAELKASGISDMTYKEYLLDMGFSEEDVDANIDYIVINALKVEIFTAYIAEKENITVTMREIFEDYGYMEEDITSEVYDMIVGDIGETAICDNGILQKSMNIFLSRMRG